MSENAYFATALVCELNKYTYNVCLDVHRLKYVCRKSGPVNHTTARDSLSRPRLRLEKSTAEPCRLCSDCDSPLLPVETTIPREPSTEVALPWPSIAARFKYTRGNVRDRSCQRRLPWAIRESQFFYDDLFSGINACRGMVESCCSTNVRC